jgi:ferredoxin-NADP reductase
MSSQIGSAPQGEHAAIGHAMKLRGRRFIAEETTAFEFEKPRNFQFAAGQFVDVYMSGVKTNGAEQLTHTFSIASSPFDEDIVLATRMRDTAFKRALSVLSIGSEVRITTAMGSVILHKNVSRPAAFLAGGIGIAPFVSMLRSAAVNKLQIPISLFYANRSLNDAAFMENLRELERSMRNFTFVPTLTRIDSAYRWNGETGHISPETLSTYVIHLQTSICYIAGPLAMVSSTRRVLIAAGVDGDDIRTEEFAGY